MRIGAQMKLFCAEKALSSTATWFFLNNLRQILTHFSSLNKYNRYGSFRGPGTIFVLPLWS
uniref:Uncharacterized protein n=1 Tax=Anguilla anguilla TaxID=7936 RepID=A0A0E9WQA1_ANGAN